MYDVLIIMLCNTMFNEHTYVIVLYIYIYIYLFTCSYIVIYNILVDVYMAPGWEVTPRNGHPTSSYAAILNM